MLNSISFFLTLYTYLSARIDKLTNELDEAKKNLQEKEENEKQLKGFNNNFFFLTLFHTFRKC